VKCPQHRPIDGSLGLPLADHDEAIDYRPSARPLTPSHDQSHYSNPCTKYPKHIWLRHGDDGSRWRVVWSVVE